MCSIVPSTDMAEKVYKRKELVLLETPIKKNTWEVLHTSDTKTDI